MDKMDLKKYGITGVTEIVYNPSYDELFREETKKGLRGFEKGQLTETGAVNVMTGVYTGRSPKDKFFVMDETTKDTIWWTSDEYKNDNKPVTKKAWKELKKIAVEELSGKRLFVVDTFCGANENSRLKIRFIMEVAWQAHFVKTTPPNQVLICIFSISIIPDSGIVESCIPFTEPLEVTVVTILHNAVAPAPKRTSLPSIAPLSCAIPNSSMRGLPPIS